MATEQEQIEKAALEYANQIVLEAQDSPEYFAFIHGVQWQKEQSANDAMKFAQWLDKGNWPAATKESKSFKQLYELWQQSKKK